MSHIKSSFLLSEKNASLKAVAATWWPLAVSWFLMSVEGPAHSAIVARLVNPEIHLAAWGGIVFPISLLMESPIVMMLSASTTLSTNWDSYKKLRRFMLILGATLSFIHVGIAFTPIYDLVVRRIIYAPEVIIEPGRWGLMIMTPWAFAIGYRRLQQGIMIRYGHSRAVGMGTIIRLLSNAFVLAIGYWVKTLPGIVIASTAVASGVVAEAIYAGLRTRLIIKDNIIPDSEEDNVLTLSRFLKFYVPLAITTMITFFVSPLGSAAMSRMPDPLKSLAAWPVVYGMIFILRSPCMAFNEVVIALIDRPFALQNLRRFASLLALGVTALTLIIAATPLAEVWLNNVMALPADLLQLSRTALWIGLFIPFSALLQNWYQGIIVSSRHTHGVTEAVILYICTIGLVLFTGVRIQSVTGLFITITAYELAGLMQAIWLWQRSRPAVNARLASKDVQPSPLNPG